MTSRGVCVSKTAQGSLSARWFQHQMGVGQDEPFRRLMGVLPDLSPLAFYLEFGVQEKFID
jgi:hypothetical protein